MLLDLRCLVDLRILRRILSRNETKGFLLNQLVVLIINLQDPLDLVLYLDVLGLEIRGFVLFVAERVEHMEVRQLSIDD